MPTLRAQLNALCVAELMNAIDIGTPKYTPDITYPIVLEDGTGANQAKIIWTDKRQIAASGNDDLDLAGGIVDALGNTITMTRLKAIILKALATNVNDVLVGGAAAAQITTLFGASGDLIRVKPGGVFMLIAPDATGYVITATTADILRITNGAGGTAVDYEITLIGTV